VTTCQLEAARLIGAPAEDVFAVLCDPRRHPDLDGSGTLRAAPDAVPLTAVGDEFVMHLEADDLGSYRSRSVVVRYEPDRAIAWSPGPVGEEPFGHTYSYVLEPEGASVTRVTQTYDWSAVTDPRLLGTLPRVSLDELSRTLDLLALAVGTS
jgi:uncharacterized protein YndB with AHSA1/START domain